MQTVKTVSLIHRPCLQRTLFIKPTSAYFQADLYSPMFFFLSRIYTRSRALKPLSSDLQYVWKCIDFCIFINSAIVFDGVLRANKKKILMKMLVNEGHCFQNTAFLNRMPARSLNSREKLYQASQNICLLQQYIIYSRLMVQAGLNGPY